MSVSEELRPALSTFFQAYCCQLPFYYMLIITFCYCFTLLI